MQDSINTEKWGGGWEVQLIRKAPTKNTLLACVSLFTLGCRSYPKRVFSAGILPSISQKLHNFSAKLPAKLMASLLSLQAWETSVCVSVCV